MQDASAQAEIGAPGRSISLGVAIVTYNSANEIDACLSSLAQWCPLQVNMTVNVVDNASQDETSFVVANRHSWVNLEVSPRNDGFAVSTNRSLRGTDADYILVLNPDTLIREGVLSRLLEVMASDSKIGVLGCRLELGNGTFDHASKRAFPDPMIAARYFVEKALRRPSTSSYLAHHVDDQGSGEVDAISGAFMLIRRKANDEVGLLDEGYWMYAEDLDWCRRFKLAGWKVYYDGTVTAIHLKGASSGKYRNLKVNWHFHYSMARFYRKFDAGSNILLDLVVYLAIALRFVVSASTSALKRLGSGRRYSRSALTNTGASH